MDNDFMDQRVQRLKHDQLERERQLRLQRDYGVFISYSHTDTRPARRLARFFEGRRIRHFLDEKKLRPGDHLGEKLLEHMETLTHCVLVLSPRSAKSRWCSYEYGIAAGQKKPVLFLMTEAGMRPPPFAQAILASNSMKEIETFFATDIIDVEALDRLIAEILADRNAVLERFVPAGPASRGRAGWDAPDAEQVRAAKADPLRLYLDDVTDATEWRLVRIELGHRSEPEAVVLHYHRTGHRPRTCSLEYNEALTAIVANEQLPNSDRVGVRERLTSGGTRDMDRALDVVEDLKGTARALYGWSASRDFWEKTFERLRDRLPRQGRITKPLPGRTKAASKRRAKRKP